jgi:dipeptidyl aminopeptidase/acylaminoacyl peptidase
MEEIVEFQNSKGNKLVGILNKTDNKDWILIMAHGFSSNKNTKNFVKLSQMLSLKSVSTFRFDFWGHGESGGKFEDITISEAVDDILNAIKFIKGLGYKKIGLLGSSFGGISSIMASSKTTDLSFLTLKSPVSDYWELEKGRYTKEELEDWKNKGVREYEDDGKFMKLNYSFVEDFDNNNAYEVAKDIKIPTLIVHGDSDDDVPYSQSQKLVSILPNAQLITIMGANHRYTEADHAEQMLNAFYGFILRQTK